MPMKARQPEKSEQPVKIDWDRVADAIRRRREELRLYQDNLPGVSHATLYKLENGKQTSYKPFILRNIEKALDWPAGTIERIGRGASPELSLEERLARVEDRLRDYEPLITGLREAAFALSKPSNNP